MNDTKQLEAQDCIDLEALKARCLGNLDVVERILEKFGTQLEADLATLEAALEARDSATFRAVAHRLKGTFANLEAWPLYACAKEAEELALTEDLGELVAHLDRFHKLRAQLAAAIKVSERPCR
jgi:HPt (histidine-containing phosphotransfer) domain-containing protein